MGTFLAIAICLSSVVVPVGQAEAASVDLLACPAIAFGSSGPCVEELQHALNVAGANPPLDVDGIAGELTVEQIRRYQAANPPLEVDGIAGPATIASLLAASPAPAAAPSPPYSGPTAGPVPPLPAPGVWENGGYYDCGTIVPQIASGHFYGPRGATAQDGTRIVEGVVALTTSNGGCGMLAEISIESKFCGFWGCQWRKLAQRDYPDLPTNGTLVTEPITAPLRSGFHRYRVRVDLTVNALEAEPGVGRAPGIIGIVRRTTITYSYDPELNG